MYILGLNAYHGDSSACIYKDGEIIAASEEERFRRIKHWAGFPSKAIEFCLTEAGITINEVDYIAVSRDPKANFSKKVLTALKNRLSLKNMINRAQNLKKANSIESEIYKHFHLLQGTLKASIVQVEHHRSHLASAFFASPFEEAAILSIDGFGDFSSTMLAIGKANQIKVLDTVSYPHSLGVFYTTLTQFLGFPHYGDEYKVMGLAPYGKPLYVDLIHKLILLKDNGLFELDLKYFNHPKNGVNMAWENGIPGMDNLYTENLTTLLGNPRQQHEELSQYHKDLAASVQQVTEEVIFHLLNHLQQKTGLQHICIAGGVAQNSVANGKIKLNTSFKHIYIPPAGHDAGTAIGAALWVWNQLENKPRTPPMFHGYLGSKFDNAYIENLLKEKNIHYLKPEQKDFFNEVTNCLINEGVVGWFQGRAEFGPRALGHRSILADPRNTKAKELLNTKIKRRESFRPFAPSILSEFVKEYFEQVDDVPFMEKVFKIKAEKRDEIPAVTHLDGTGRLQTVHQHTDEKYYQLIKSFRDKTGTPILLNTSFNENEPIVNTPEEALDCFLRTKMDMLVMEDIIIKK
ncbi:carbamoyltransferase family protein [Pedobacter miscanthi]|uniref:Carbamoyltransferase n=1 Tax=Pedobacter miscanthi TaxID=2259170 RepID=A0A366LA30_9SPHI|nr:carbamoyltransferase C-terminal domain-containing protein [Pedobacter miscanthi]RBQ09992.1 carbamoyltransferase [Pedobacter miscanthi]